MKSIRFSSLALCALGLCVAPGLFAAACSATTNHNTFTGSGGAGAGGGGVGPSATTSTGSSTSNGGEGGGLMIDAGHHDDGGVGGGGDPVDCATAASAHTYIGCDFWPTVVANNVWSIFDYAVVVANAGNAPADVTVQRMGNTLQQVTVQPNGLQTIYLPWVPELKGPDGDTCGSVVALTSTVRSNGGAYHLTSSVPVTVYQFSALEYQGKGGPPGKNWSSCPGNQICDQTFSAVGCFSFTNDASLLLPSTAMTGNYRITGQADWSLVPEGAYFAVTGTVDGTNVKVYVPGGGHIAGGGGVSDTGPNGTISFSLNAGDVVELVGNGNSDNAGTLVQADKPVQVISGMPCVYQPYDINYPACDHLEESVFPAETLGKHYFVTVPTSPHGNPVGHIVRIVGNVDGTTISYPSGNQPAGAPTSLKAGQVVDLGQVSKSFEISGDHEFAVVTFSLGASIVDPNAVPPMQEGDPDQTNVTAVEQYRLKYVFLAPTDYDRNYVDIIQPMGTSVTIDGTAVGAAVTPIGSGFGIARASLGPGNNGAHVLVASQPVGIQVMGYGAYTSYMYPGGLNLGVIAPPPPPPH